VAVAMASVMLLVGCSHIPSMYAPYPQQMKPIRQVTQQGNEGAAVQALQPALKSDDWQLYSLETARLLQLQGDYPSSISLYDRVVGSATQSMLRGDHQGFFAMFFSGGLYDGSARPYQIPPYELILAYQNDAFSYLATGNVQTSLVVFRQVNALEDYLDANYLNDINKMNQDFDEDSILHDGPSYQNLIANTYKPASVSWSIQNGLIDLIASFVFFNTGDFSTAQQELQRAQAHSPVAMRQFMMTKLPDAHARNSQVWVLLEQGFVPLRQQKNYTFYTSVWVAGHSYNLRAIFSMPIYVKSMPALGNFSVAASGVRSDFVPLLNIGDLAAASLRERYMLYLSTADMQVASQVSDIRSDVVALSKTKEDTPQRFDARNQVRYDEYPRVTPADLRSWSTLPNDIQLAKLELPAGSHAIKVQDKAHVVVAGCSIKVARGKIALVWVNLQTQQSLCLQLL
jgi:hypothetical protein